MADYSRDPFLATPRQASDIFSPNGAHPIRQKHLFLVRFLRQASVSQDWKDSLSFVVKQMDRPSVEASTETLNQYNKKRIVHTGVKYNNVNVTFYDTADNAAQNMWLEYASYHYGDYNQPENSFNDDLLNATMMDVDRRGYGFHIQKSADHDGIGSQHFFNALEVYQLWGNEYTSYRLLNPRIATFTPDELDYSTSEVGTVTLSIAYEAISHYNNGRSADLLSDQTLKSIFSDGPFGGHLVEFQNNQPAQSFLMPSDAIPLSRVPVANFRDETVPEVYVRSSATIGSGSLARYGDYDFGSTAEISAQPTARNAALLSDSLSGFASGVNSAAQQNGTLPFEQVDRRDGAISLSDDAINAYNRTSDGTILLGSNKTINT